jgi:hypothetical protein
LVKKSLYGILAAVIIIVLVGSVVGYTLLNQPTSEPSTTISPSPSATATPTPSPSEEPESSATQVRDETMNYIECYHPETTEYMQNLNWTGGRVETGFVGSENYEYTTLTDALGSSGWTVTISYPVVLDPLYTLTVNYTQTGVQNPIEICWNGTWQNGTITETSYLSNINENQTPTQEQVRNGVMSYIQSVHVETADYMQDLNWTGGEVETMLVGSVQYVYTTVHGTMGGAWWTVEINNPVIPNPTYTVNVNYTQTGVQTPYAISWNGTWQDSNINETGYSSNVPVTQEQIRDSIMNYIKISHNQTEQFMQDMTWTGGKVETGTVGYETYNYTTLISAPGAAGWTVIIEYPVTLNPIHTVSANYTQTGVQSPYEVAWIGTWQTGTITETSYTFVAP